jgi:hypothetical protein
MEINIDQSIVKELQKVPIPEYGIFDNFSDNEIHNQMQFLADTLLMANPKRILEIGTNHCYFPYFANCICPGVLINTVDINEKATIGVNFLKNKGYNITFHNKPSSEFFKDFSEQVDYAWVDGSHVYADCLQDLRSCGRLGIKVICVDDFRYNLDVFRAAFDFYREFPGYSIYGQSYFYDHRGIVCFIKSELSLP